MTHVVVFRFLCSFSQFQGTVYDGVVSLHHTKIHILVGKLTICSSLLCEYITELFKEATPASFPGSLTPASFELGSDRKTLYLP